MVFVSSTAWLLATFVIYYAVWLDGMAYAKPKTYEEDTLLELERLQEKEDQIIHDLKKNREAKMKPMDKTVNADCGGSFDTTPGTISHPLNAKNYGNNERCVWTISSSIPLYFYFSKFNTESIYDFITARNGGTIGSPKLGTYSGKSLETTFITDGDAHIQFDSDENVIGRGFDLHWRIYTAEEQCKAVDGVCVKTGDTCSGIFTMFENSCEDSCACCHPE